MIQPPNSVEPQGGRSSGMVFRLCMYPNFCWLLGMPLASTGTASALDQAGPDPCLCVHWSDPTGSGFVILQLSTGLIL